jgi:hypothetical protein
MANEMILYHIIFRGGDGGTYSYPQHAYWAKNFMEAMIKARLENSDKIIIVKHMDARMGYEVDWMEVDDASDTEEALLKAKLRNPTASVFRCELWTYNSIDQCGLWTKIWEAES